MLTNRSAPHARVTPVLTVSYVRAAVAWYTDVFGFVEHVRIGDGHRSQLGLPNGPAAEVVVAEIRPGRRTPRRLLSHQVMLKVADVMEVVERAIARGAQLVDRLMTGSTANARQPSRIHLGISGSLTRRCATSRLSNGAGRP